MAGSPYFAQEWAETDIDGVRETIRTRMLEELARPVECWQALLSKVISPHLPTSAHISPHLPTFSRLLTPSHPLFVWRALLSKVGSKRRLTRAQFVTAVQGVLGYTGPDEVLHRVYEQMDDDSSNEVNPSHQPLRTQPGS